MNFITMSWSVFSFRLFVFNPSFLNFWYNLIHPHFISYVILKLTTRLTKNTDIYLIVQRLSKHSRFDFVISCCFCCFSKEFLLEHWVLCNDFLNINWKLKQFLTYFFTFFCKIVHLICGYRVQLATQSEKLRTVTRELYFLICSYIIILTMWIPKLFYAKHCLGNRKVFSFVDGVLFSFFCNWFVNECSIFTSRYKINSVISGHHNFTLFLSRLQTMKLLKIVFVSEQKQWIVFD